MSLSGKVSPNIYRQVKYAETLVQCKKEDAKMIREFLLTQKQLPFESQAELQIKIINDFRMAKCGAYENLMRWSLK